MSIQATTPTRVARDAPAVFSRLTLQQTPTISRQSSAPQTPSAASSPSHRGPLTKSGCHSPYAATVLPSQGGMTPTMLPPSVAASWDNAAAQTTSASSSHDASTKKRNPKGNVRFLEFPPSTEGPVGDLSARNTTHPKLFLGQLRFEATASDIYWLLQHCLDVSPLLVTIPKPGTAIVVLETYYDADLVRSFHKRALFDFTGVWVADSDDECKALSECARTHITKLPKDCMSVEELRNNQSHYNPHHHNPTNQRWNAQQAPQPPSYGDTVVGGAAGRNRTASDEWSTFGITGSHSQVSTPAASQSGTPSLRPRTGSDPLAMSPVVVDAPRYGPGMFGSM